jgi:hypothetical protein
VSAAPLLALVQAQSRALDREDFETFERLAAERTALQAVAFAKAGPESREQLEQVAALDDRNTVVLRSLLAETARELAQLRRGQSALRGYGHQTPAGSALELVG